MEVAVALGNWSLHSDAFVLKKVGAAQRVVANTTGRTTQLFASTAFTVSLGLLFISNKNRKIKLDNY